MDCAICGETILTEREIRGPWWNLIGMTLSTINIAMKAHYRTHMPGSP